MKYKHIIVMSLGLALIGGACAKPQTSTQTTNQQSGQTNTTTNQASTELTAADQAGKHMSGDHCTGTDKPKFTHLPMDPKDVAFILPYGLMVGGHVTPVDHQYFSPIIFNSPLDTYNVYAMADGHLVDIQTREHQGQGQNAGKTVTDHRLVFYSSCHLLYYYDLITSLTPGLEDQLKAAGGDLAVTSGQLIGKIGGQTLDFAVWDTEQALTGYIVPEHYGRESWKIYTADPLNYYNDTVKAQALALYIRTAEPTSGKIDYDVDGKLIGTWFAQNPDGTTNGYAGTGKNDYWTTHLSFSPYFLDPTSFLISIGNWPVPEGASQFATKSSTPNPADVDVNSGLVKYDLVKFEDHKADGSRWDNMTLPHSPITLGKKNNVEGCILVQMTAARTLTAETFKGKTCSSINSFTNSAVTYIR